MEFEVLDPMVLFMRSQEKLPMLPLFIQVLLQLQMGWLVVQVVAYGVIRKHSLCDYTAKLDFKTD